MATDGTSKANLERLAKELETLIGEIADAKEASDEVNASSKKKMLQIVSNVAKSMRAVDDAVTGEEMSEEECAKETQRLRQELKEKNALLDKIKVNLHAWIADLKEKDHEDVF